MKRLIVFALVVLCGCKAPQGSAVDPFFGQTRVRPPNTERHLIQPPGDSYYQNTDSHTSDAKTNPQELQTQVVAAAGQQKDDQARAMPSANYTLPDGYGYSGEVVKRSRSLGTNGSKVILPPSAIRNERAEKSAQIAAKRTRLNGLHQPIRQKSDLSPNVTTATSSAVAFARSATSPNGSDASTTPTLANRERIVRTIEPRHSSKVVRASAIETCSPEQRLNHIDPPPSRVVDLMDLPEASESLKSGSHSGTVQTAVAMNSVEDTGESKAVPFSSISKYGYDRQYTRLKGKLEYSQIDHKWKLRYIPIDGNTDSHGGSVVISDSTLLSGCERGDFVEIWGSLAKQAKKGPEFAPLYNVSQVRLLGS